MKKIVCFLMIAVALFTAACAPISGEPEKSNTVLLCMGSINFSLYQIVQLGFQEGAQAAGLTPILSGSDNGSTQELEELFRSDAAEQKAVGAVVWASDDTYYQLMRDWSANDVKTVVPHFSHEQTETESFIHANISGNPQKRGYLAADTLVAMLREKGITSGTIGFGSGGMTVPNQTLRYMRERLTQIAPEYTQADTVFLGMELEEAWMKAAGIINSYPDLVAIYADANLSGGQAIVKAAEQAGRDDLILMAVDESKENLDLLEAGKLDALMVTDLYQEGYQSAQILAKLIAGEETEWHIELEEKVLTKDSDLTYYKDIWNRTA